MRKRLAGGLAVAVAVAGSAFAIMNAVSATAATTATADTYTWKNVRIDGGGFVDGVVFSRKQQNLIYARTDIGGAYRWNNSTSTWTPLLDWVGQSNWGYNGVVSIAADPTDATKVYAAVGMYTNSWDPNNGAILRSSDQGATWTATALPFKLGGNMPGRGMGERLSIDPNKPSVLYFAAPSGKGLWKSTDSGVTWAQVTNFPNVGNYVQDASNAYTADNQGDTWVTFDPKSGSSGSVTPGIYVGVADKNNTVYRSTDGGSTWSTISGIPTGYLAHKGVIDETNRLLYISTSDTGGPYDGAKGDVWKYDIAAGTWTQISPILSSSSDDYFGYSGLTIDRQTGAIMVATQVSWWPDMIMWRSLDHGATWTRIWDWTSYPSRSLRYTMDTTTDPWLNFGVTSAVDPVPAQKLGWMNESVEIDPFNSDRMMYGTGATLYGTTNLTAWDSGGQIAIKPMARGLEETSVLDLVSPPSGAPLFSALGDIAGFKHTDLTTVQKWTYTAPTFGSTTSIDFAESNPTIMVRVGNLSSGSTETHIGVSTSSGDSWWAGADTGTVTSGGGVAMAADGSSIVWAPGGGSAVYYSTTYGSSWSTSTTVPAGAIVKSDRVNAKTFYAFSNGTVYVSTDGGATFTAKASGLPTSGQLKTVFGQAGNVWLATSSGLYRSTDAGTSFTNLTTADSSINVGFGKAATGANYPAIYMIGAVGGVSGVFRSDDTGSTWVRINTDAHQYGNAGAALTGDPRVYGRVYLGTNGRGIIYADTTGTTTVSPTAGTSSSTSSPSGGTSSSSAPASSSAASSSATSPTSGTKSCTAAYSVTSSWSGGFVSDVKVTAGSAAITAWKVTMVLPSGATITSVWSGVNTGTTGTVTVVNAAYNGALAAAGSTDFGFQGTGTGTGATVTCTAS